jgi:hypothetical protein
MRVGYDQTSRGLDATLHRRRRSTLPSSVPGDRARTRARHSALIRNGSTTGGRAGIDPWKVSARTREVAKRGACDAPRASPNADRPAGTRGDQQSPERPAGNLQIGETQPADSITASAHSRRI